MSASALLLISPWLLLGGALIALLLLISFVRGHGLAAVVTVVALLATALLALMLALSGDGLGQHADLPLLRVDGLALVASALFAVAGAAVAGLSWRYLEGRAVLVEEYYVLLLCAVFGAMTVAAADHFAVVVLGLEILSIALYALIAYPERGDAPLEAGLKYLVLSGVASTTLLFGVALLYAHSGALTFVALAPTGAEGEGALLRVLGAALVLAGIAFKLSLVPFHMWTPDVYQGAPAPVTGFLATVTKGAVLVLLLRIVQQADVLADPPLYAVLATFAVLSMLVGNLLAVGEDSVKRVLAYSSTAHMGYLLVAVLAFGAGGDASLGIEAALVYVVAYTAMTLTAFGVVAALSAGNPDEIDAVGDWSGLLWTRPGAAVVFAIALLSLAGIPLTAGFVAKFYLVAAGVDRGLWLLLWVLVAGSGIGLYYYLRILFSMIRAAPADAAPPVALGASGGWVLGVLALATLWVGVWPAPLIELVRGVLD